MLQIIDSGKQSASTNMAIDERLLASLDPDGSPILHLYDWERPSITYGHFIKIDRFFDREEVAKKNVELAKRPTGGGVVFHIWDLAFSFLLPSKNPNFSKSPIENYAFVHSLLAKVLEPFFQIKNVHMIPEDRPVKEKEGKFFCMARPTKYDLLLGDRKIAGAAQRKKKEGYLHQGTISLSAPIPEYLNLLLLPALREEIYENSFSPIPFSEIEEVRKKLKNEIKEEFSRRFL